MGGPYPERPRSQGAPGTQTASHREFWPARLSLKIERAGNAALPGLVFEVSLKDGQCPRWVSQVELQHLLVTTPDAKAISPRWILHRAALQEGVQANIACVLGAEPQ